MRAATSPAWARPAADRWRSGARPGRIFPVVGVVPWRTMRTTVGRGTGVRRLGTLVNRTLSERTPIRPDGGASGSRSDRVRKAAGHGYGCLRPPLSAHSGQPVQEGDGSRVIVSRTGLHRTVGDHPIEQIPSLVGSYDGQRPIIERADAPGGDVGVLGREVRARLASFASPGLCFFEWDLVELAVSRPHLKHALDVHLGDIGAGNAVFGLELSGEDGVVERLGAEQADRQGEPADRKRTRLNSSHL